MKKLFYFTALVFIVSLISYSCKKEENPLIPPSKETPSTISWKNFKKTGLNIPIGPGITEDTLNAVITADFFPTNYIKNLNLTLDDISDVDASKLKFDLIHLGDTVRAIDTLNNGGIGNSFTRTVLSDSSTDPIRLATPPFTGIYQPANPFSIFRDSPPEGAYKLRIFNSGILRTGVIKSWGITVTYSPLLSNSCLEFNGTNQYGLVDNSTSINSMIGNQTFTIEGWYYVLGYSTGYFSFLDKQNSWYCEYSGSDSSWTLVDPGSPTAKYKIPIVFGTWYHIAISYNGLTNTTKFYSNGQYIGSSSSTLSFAQNNNPLNVARGISGAVEYGNGRYDEIRIWNIIRSDAEISANYNKSLTGNESGLVLYFRFNEGTGSSFIDASPNGNNGVLYNNPIWITGGPNIIP